MEWRRWLVLACIINLSLLAWFKYANFFIENLLEIAHLAGAEKDAPHLSIILPLGISFYVFELISYLADIYRRRIGHERSLLVFSLFVLFFPHLIAGPICRATQFVPQVKQLQTFTSSQFYNGLYLLCGFALKCGIADGVAPFVNVIFNAGQLFRFRQLDGGTRLRYPDTLRLLGLLPDGIRGRAAIRLCPTAELQRPLRGTFYSRFLAPLAYDPI